MDESVLPPVPVGAATAMVPVSVLDELATALARMARSLEHQSDIDETLAGIVEAAITLIPGAEQASISVVVNRKIVEPRAASGDIARRVDEVQTETGQGPCLDAIYTHHTVLVPDMATETRWPDFAAVACTMGVASMLSFQLFVTDDNLGSLNLFSSQPNAFTEESEHVGLLFAAHAAVAFADMQTQEQLGVALSSRDVIGQAKGILMERHQVSGDQAFAILSRYSQEQNLKLRDVAEQLVGTYEKRGSKGAAS